MAAEDLELPEGDIPYHQRLRPADMRPAERALIAAIRDWATRLAADGGRFDGPAVRAAETPPLLDAVLRLIAARARRPIDFRPPGHRALGADEALFLFALAAAQAGLQPAVARVARAWLPAEVAGLAEEGLIALGRQMAATGDLLPLRADRFTHRGPALH